MFTTVEDYLAKIDINEILYINKIPLDKIILPEIPKLNPVTLKYAQFWKAETEKCVDGFWVEHNKEWKYVPGVMYFYASHWHILLDEEEAKSKTKVIARPRVRDLEWIKSFLFMEARGFSGFEEDEEYTCHREVSLPEEERTPIFLTSSCYKKNGELKTYISARKYLKMYLTKPLGIPLYENQAKDIIDLESRGTGKSYFMACLIGYTFTFDGAQHFEDYWDKGTTENPLSSETLVGAIDSKYSGDLIKKVRLGLESFKGSFTLGRTTTPAPFSKSYSGQWNPGPVPIIQETLRKVGGQWAVGGTRSKIHHRTFSDNPHAATGTRASLNVIDEIGLASNLLPTLVNMKECTASGERKNGTIWMPGTGGAMAGGATQASMSVFYDPKTYECLEFYDNYEGSGTQIGLFIPAWMGLNGFKDKLGNTDYKQAIQYLLNIRSKLAKGKKREAYDGELCQRPITPSEVFLIAGGNILPTGMLKDQLTFLETTTSKDYEGAVGRMKTTPEGKPTFVLDTDMRACDWPVKKGSDHTGAVQIWEQPVENAGFGYYLAGNDPYDIDKAPNSPSLGSLIVMKRESPGVSGYDIIVAEYTARPDTAIDFYEQARLLLMYYGIVGTCLYENERVGIQTYFTNHNCAYLLAKTPSTLKANQTSNVNRGIGQHMSTKVKEECEIHLRDWLIASAGEGKLNLHHIYSKPILKELINYNKIGNFDRVIALMLCVIQKTQMHKIVSEAIEEEKKQDPFFSRSLFGGTRPAGRGGYIGF